MSTEGRAATALSQYDAHTSWSKDNIVNFKRTFNLGGRAADDENVDKKTLWGI